MAPPPPLISLSLIQRTCNLNYIYVLFICRSETMSQNEGGSEEQVTKAAELTTPPESPRAVKSPAKLPPPLSRTKPRPPVDSGVQRPPPQQIDIADLERFFAAGFQKMEQDFTEK